MLFLLYAGTAFSQDVIITVAGTHIKCNVQDIGDDSISYTDFGIAAAKLKALPRKDIYVITYHNNAPTDTITKPVIPVVKKVKPPVSGPAPVSNTPATANSASTATIFTTDGKQIACNVTEIDESSISYTLPGTTAEVQIGIPNVSRIKYSNGAKDDVFNNQNNAPVFVAGKTNRKPDEALSMAAILQNWKRKYISPPLEIF